MSIKEVRRRRGRRPRVVKPIPVVPAQPFVQHAFGERVEFLGNAIPMVLMTREVYSRMWHFVDIATQEVSWLGTVRVTPYGNYLIEEVFLLEQEVTATQTELSGEGQAQLAQHLIDTRPDGVDVVNRIFFWGHSHVNMGTSPSVPDDEQMEKFRGNGCPWFIRGILNKLGRMEFSIYLWEAGVKIMDVSWAIREQVDGSIRPGIEAEFREKVKQRTYTSYTPLVGVGAFNGLGPVALANAMARYAIQYGGSARPPGVVVGARFEEDEESDHVG